MFFYAILWLVYFENLRNYILTLTGAISPRYGFEASIQTIATYESNGRAGMIAFPYGNGTVFLSSPHPE